MARKHTTTRLALTPSRCILAKSTHQKRRGAFQSIPVLRAFSVFYTSYGISGQIPTGDPGVGNRPIGVLAIAAAAVCHPTSMPVFQTHSVTQVERGYYLHRTGDYVRIGNDFSASNWLRSTNTFVHKIKTLTSENWTGIFDALHRLRDADTQTARIKVGAVVQEEHEPLLPDDPPSSPPA